MVSDGKTREGERATVRRSELPDRWLGEVVRYVPFHFTPRPYRSLPSLITFAHYVHLLPLST